MDFNSIMAVALERAAYGQPDESGYPSESTQADVAAILALLGEPDEDEGQDDRASPVSYAFNPDEPRGQPDNAGQWVAGGGKGKSDDKGDSEPEDAAADYKANGTKSKAFKAWFGDWEADPANASKVVDEDGSPKETGPIPVYHGTKMPDIEEFKKGRSGGIFFTDKGTSDDFTGGSGKVVACYLSIKNPLDLQEFDGNDPKGAEALRDALIEKGFPEKEATRIFRIDEDDPESTLISHYLFDNRVSGFIEKHFDGMIFNDYGTHADPEKEYKSYVVFQPHQVKSVHNAGTFDPSDARINYESHHAPAGGVTIGNKTYVGGEFIPGDEVEKASPEEKAQLDVKRSIPEKIKHAPAALKEALSRENIESAADAIVNGVKHPGATAGKALSAAKSKLASIYDDYGAAGVAAVGAAYVAYYAAAAANPVMLTVPVPLTATILTCAKLVKSGLKAIKGTKAAQYARDDPDRYETPLAPPIPAPVTLTARLSADLAALTAEQARATAAAEASRAAAQVQREKERVDLLEAIRSDDAQLYAAQKQNAEREQLIAGIRAALKTDIAEAVSSALPSPITSRRPERGLDGRYARIVCTHADGSESVQTISRDADGQAVSVGRTEN